MKVKFFHYTATQTHCIAKTSVSVFINILVSVHLAAIIYKYVRHLNTGNRLPKEFHLITEQTLTYAHARNSIKFVFKGCTHSRR